MNALVDVMHDEVGVPLSAHQAEALLSRTQVREGGSLAIRELDALLQALLEPHVEGPVLGEAAALAAFRGVAPAMPARGSHLSLVKPGRRGLVAVGVAAAVLVGASGAAAAYTGHLPDSLQGLAHRAVGAPAANSRPPAEAVVVPWGVPQSPGGAATATSSQAGTPPATSSALFGLCRKVDRTGSDRVINPKSAAHRQLAAAAAAQSQSIVAYCATVIHPGSSKASGKSGSSGTATKPAAGNGSGNASAEKPANTPKGKPAMTPGGKPTSVPPSAPGRSSETPSHHAAATASPAP